MQRDPSDPGGLRTSSTSDRPGDLGRETILRASLGWGLVVLGILVGFGVGSRIGSAEDTTQSDRFVSETEHSNGAQAAPMDARSALAHEVLSAVADRDRAGGDAGSTSNGVSAGPEIPAQTTAQGSSSIANALTRASSSADSARASASAADDLQYALAAKGRPVPIDKLPIYEDEFDAEAMADEFEGDDATATSAVIDPSNAIEQGGTESLTIVTRGKIKRGESLGSSMRRQGIKPSTVHLIAKEMRKVFDFRRSRPGDRYRLGQDSGGRVLDFRYSQSE